MFFNNNRLSHWFAGALLTWIIIFFVWGLLIFHYWYKVPISTVAIFSGIGCATQLSITPWLFSARATQQNPSGRITQRASVVIIFLSLIALLFFYFVRHAQPEDMETRRFTSIGFIVTIVFGLLAFTILRLASRGRQSSNSSARE